MGAEQLGATNFISLLSRMSWAIHPSQWNHGQDDAEGHSDSVACRRPQQLLAALAHLQGAGGLAQGRDRPRAERMGEGSSRLQCGRSHQLERHRNDDVALNCDGV